MEIPEDVESSGSVASDGLRYYSQNPNDRALIGWLESTVNDEVRNRRLRAAGIDPARRPGSACP